MTKPVMKRLTTDKAEKITKMRENGWNRADCALEVGAPEWIVARFLECFDITTPQVERMRKQRAETQDFIAKHGDELVGLGKQGWTVRQMADHYGFRYKAIKHWMETNGHYFRPQKKHTKTPKPKGKSLKTQKPKMRSGAAMFLGIKI